VILSSETSAAAHPTPLWGGLLRHAGLQSECLTAEACYEHLILSVRDSLAFIRQSLGNFRQTGAILPSSGALARAMVDAIGPILPGDILVELGPGTGVFTRQIRKRYPDNPLIAVEFNEPLAERLRHTHPDVHVVCGCASEIRIHVEALGLNPNRIGVVLSGLPLLSLPRPLCDAILAGLGEVVPLGRRYVQFTYSQRAWQKWHLAGFRRDNPRRVWLNVPPASVLAFTRSDA